MKHQTKTTRILRRGSVAVEMDTAQFERELLNLSSTQIKAFYKIVWGRQRGDVMSVELNVRLIRTAARGDCPEGPATRSMGA